MNNITVAFKVTDFDLEMATLSELLNKAPTDFHKKGDKYIKGPPNNLTTERYKYNFWEFRIHVKNNEVWVQDIVDRFIEEILDPMKQGLSQLIGKSRLELYICIRYRQGHRLESFHFTNDKLRFLSAHNIQIDIEQYQQIGE